MTEQSILSSRLRSRPWAFEDGAGALDPTRIGAFQSGAWLANMGGCPVPSGRSCEM